jgi:hypothetical protein
MRKLSLKPDELRVQSFAANDRTPGGAGHPSACGRRPSPASIPAAGPVVQRESCYNGCTYDDC